MFSSVTFIGTITYASNASHQGSVDFKNQLKRLTAGAGCMGCHQGETTARNEFMNTSSNYQGLLVQKPKNTPEVSKHKVQQG